MKTTCAKIKRYVLSNSHIKQILKLLKPVFVICGESAGIAAVQVIDQNFSVQNIDQSQYQKKLISIRRIMEAGHAFDTIAGNGRILLADDIFPAYNAKHFILLGQDEGKVEYYETGFNFGQSRTFCNLEVNLSNSIDHLIMLADYQLNGNLTVTQGRFQIDDNASKTRLNITVDGDVRLEANGSIRLGTADAYAAQGAYGNWHKSDHVMTVGGNFTTYGTVRFRKLDIPHSRDRNTSGAIA